MDPRTILIALTLAACSGPASESPWTLDRPSTDRTVATAPGPPSNDTTRGKGASRTRTSENEFGYYRVRPNSEQVDQYCGAYDRSYVKRPVRAVRSQRAVLKLALRALFHETWERPSGQVRRVEIENRHATVDLASWKGLGFASTSCGGVSFLGAILRTTFQFDTVHSLELSIKGSCRSFGKIMQSGRCEVFTRSNLSPRR